MPRDDWAKHGKNWRYYKPEARREGFFKRRAKAVKRCKQKKG